MLVRQYTLGFAVIEKSLDDHRNQNLPRMSDKSDAPIVAAVRRLLFFVQYVEGRIFPLLRARSPRQIRVMMW